MKLVPNGNPVSAVRVEVTNRNMYAAAPASKTRITKKRCADDGDVGAIYMDTPALAPGGSTTQVRPYQKHAGEYLLARANATSSVPEALTSNNQGTNKMGVCGGGDAP